MTDIRRYHLPGSLVLITSVCHQRQPFLRRDEHKELLLAVMREVKMEQPYQMRAYVIMQDHFHWLIKLPDDGDFSSAMQAVKLRFTHRYKKLLEAKANLTIWQRRFWDHVIRDEEDLKRHINYIHYNPVKHGDVGRPVDYRWSSFHAHVARGYYPVNWGETEPDGIKHMDME